MSAFRTSVLLAAGLCVLTGTAFAARNNSNAYNPLRVAVIAEAGSTGVLQFRLSNSGNRALKIPNWQTPIGGLAHDIFELSLNGQAIEYTGMLAKRTAPAASDFLTLRPGETRVVTVDLADSYDLSQTGQYTINFKSNLQWAQDDQGRALSAGRGRMALLQSAPIQSFVDGAQVKARQELEAQVQGKKPPPSGGGTVVGGISYVGCSSTQINTIGQAVGVARQYTETAKGYFGGNAGDRYTWWFGGFSNNGWDTATSNFQAIDSAMDMSAGQIKINCGCNQSYYAYVYPAQAYQIYVCRAFWTAPTSGTDSKAGTLIHEMSHFNVVAGTDDHAYGQTAAHNLALSSPSQALDNADSHEYFSENTPNRN